MHVLQTTFQYALNDMVVDQFEDGDMHINVAIKFSSLRRKHGRAIRGENDKGV